MKDSLNLTRAQYTRAEQMAWRKIPPSFTPPARERLGKPSSGWWRKLWWRLTAKTVDVCPKCGKILGKKQISTVEGPIWYEDSSGTKLSAEYYLCYCGYEYATLWRN